MGMKDFSQNGIMEVSCIVLTFNNIQELLGIVAYPFNPSILEADTGELL